MDVTRIPFNSFLGIERCDEKDDALLFLQDSIRYTNHLNTVHASAQFALAEAASGEYLFRRFRHIVEKQTIIPVVRKAEVKFRKPAQGKIKASASISDELAGQTAAAIDKRGRAIIPVTVNITDSSGNTTMTAIYEWFIQKIEKPA